MKHTIKKIFRENILVLGMIDKIILYFRVQNYEQALRRSTEALEHLSIALQVLLEETNYFIRKDNAVDLNMFTELMGGLLGAQENKDYVLLADLYELRMVPYLFQIQEFIMANEDELVDQDIYQKNLTALKDRNEELYRILIEQMKLPEEFKQGYQIEYTSCGLKTVIYTIGNRSHYLHSNRNAISEAFSLANSWYEDDKSEYIIYGLGLGYHISELAEINPSITIDVYESDIHIIQMACEASDFYVLLENDRIHIHYDPDFSKLMECIRNMKEEALFVIHYPSLCKIKNDIVKDSLEAYFIQYSSIKNQIYFLNSNFHENIKRYDDYVDSLKDSFTGKDLYIIAAGPSLDKNFMKLKKIEGDSIILATCTVFRKLVEEGILPDYVIVTDANPRVYSQMKNLENTEVSLLFMSTAYQDFAKNFKGRKYIILQRGFKKAEEYAEKSGGMLYQTGGSVSTAALDIGITFGCKRIIFLGLDLAYTDNYDHASGTSRRYLENGDGLQQIEDIYGNMVCTSKNLSIYRQWIENRIKGIKDIEFIDATEGGAKIKGMRVAKLSDVINESR